MAQIPSDVLTAWKLPTAKCPGCGTPLDAATKAYGGEGGPTPGALSICFACLQVNEFVDSGNGELGLQPCDFSALEPEDREDLNLLLAHLRQSKN